MKIIFIPENLQLEAVLQAHPPKFAFKKDKFLYIIHLITEIPAFKKELQNRHYIPISSTLLQGVIHDYKKYIDYLLEQGIFETDNQYILSEKCIGYRFKFPYNCMVKEASISDFTLCKNLDNYQILKNSPTRYKKLHRFFNSSLTINYDTAREYLINELHSGNFTIQAYNANLLAISKFKNQEYYFSVDSTAGRLHTNLTGLKSELRQFVKYGGQQLVSVDVKNSQPFLSTLLLTKEFYQTTTPIPFSLDSLNSTMPKPIQFSNQTTTSLIMLVNNSEVPDNTNVSDISIYREKVITGTFYEYLGNQIEKKCDVRIDDRQQLKEMVFTVLYSDNRFIGGLKAWPKRLFRNTFPTVYKVFYHLKQKAHNTLAILLQSIESHFILDFVVKRIVSEKPNMPIFTIHDSVVCQVGNEEYIKTIIQEEAMKCFGVAPVLKIEFWNPTVNTS